MVDRSAIMRDAHRRFRDSKRLGLGFDFARCLRQAWFSAKHKQMFQRQRYNPDTREERIDRAMVIIESLHDHTLQELATR